MDRDQEISAAMEKGFQLGLVTAVGLGVFVFFILMAIDNFQLVDLWDARRVAENQRSQLNTRLAPKQDFGPSSNAEGAKE